MKKVVIFTVIILMFLTLPVYAQSRLFTLQAEGEIDYLSKTGNQVTTSAVSIQGEGKLDYTMSGKVGALSMEQEHEMAMIGPLTAIIAVFTAAKEYADLKDEDDRYIYALMVAPGEGKTGYLNAKFNSVTEEKVTTFSMEAEAMVDGELRNYIEMKDSNSTLYEELQIRGWAYYLDLLKR